MKTLCITLGLVFALAGVSSAQIAVDNTTLTTTITAADRVVVLGSVTCTGCTFGPGAVIFIDSEAMRVAGSYVSGTTVPILRAQFGTKAAAHLTSIPPYGAQVVYYGPAIRFPTVDPSPGSCRPRTQWQFLPWINVTNGLFWLCDNYNWRSLSLVTFNNVAPSR